jgi:glutathione S-transferase
MRTNKNKEHKMKLYDLELSGNCYKVRLLAAFAGIDLEIIPVDFLAGEHKQSPLIDMNPWGEIPILVDGDLILRDSQAILIYLAKKHAGAQWWPEDAALQAQVAQWLFTASNEIQHGPNAARLVDKFGYSIDKASTLKNSARILGLLEQHLSQHDWLALNRPTLGECAVFPYVALAHEGGINLGEYPSVQAWITRIKELPGFIGMPAI